MSTTILLLLSAITSDVPAPQTSQASVVYDQAAYSLRGSATNGVGFFELLRRRAADPPSPSPPPPGDDLPLWPAWVAGGVAAASTAVGVGLGIDAMTDPNGRERSVSTANVAYAIGGGSAVATVAYLIVKWATDAPAE